MTILDRYIIRQFLVNFFILFTVLVGLYVLMDLIINFDEFVGVAQHADGPLLTRLWHTLLIMFDYYLPQTMMLYVYMAGLLPVAAAGFTLAGLIRNREVVAMLASGVSMYRVATPLLLMGFAANVLLMVDQELVMPQVAYKLIRGASNLKNGTQPLGNKIHFLADGRGTLFTARLFNIQDLSLSDLTILRREPVAGSDGIYSYSSERIDADRATWDEKRQGWLLTNGQIVHRDSPLTDSAAPGAVLASQPIDFLPSDLDPLSILARMRSRYRQMISLHQLSELIDRSAQTKAVDTGDLLRIRHCRFSLILINMLILGVGLPYFLLRAPAPLLIPAMKAASVTIGAWASGMIMMQVAPGFLPPAAVAWMPVAIYLPWAWYRMESIET